uniref:Uncharacterized protein n=1 Tax=Plectus sambesii TaxID=2011161 RepID=A0A914UV27_9BILA
MLQWAEKHFSAVLNCNTYGLHVVEQNGQSKTLVSTWEGRLIIFGEEQEILSEMDLLNTLDESIESNQYLEMVTADSAAIVTSLDDQGDLAFFATCWVVCETSGNSVRFLAALFRVRNDGVNLVTKLNLPTPPTYCRLTGTSSLTNGLHVWLIFTAARAVRCITIEPTTGANCEIESIGDIYPELELGALPGATLRTSCLTTSVGRWSAIGCDTGYVIASVSSHSQNLIIDRAELKFSGPISVLNFLPEYDDGSNNKSVHLLISSTLGPAAIWSLTFSSTGKLKWNRQCVLDQSNHHDSIVCGAVGDDVVCVGTYGQVLLLYRTDELDSQMASPASTLHVQAPILSIGLANDCCVTILSSKGCHLYQGSQSPLFSLPDDSVSSK